jgi:hypothetical protein
MVNARTQAFQLHPGATGMVMADTAVAQFIRSSCFNFTPLDAGTSRQPRFCVPRPGHISISPRTSRGLSSPLRDADVPCL